MTDKLYAADKRYSEIEKLLADANVASNPAKFAALSKEYKRLTPIVEEFRVYCRANDDAKEAKEILDNESDADLRALAEEEYYEKRKQSEESYNRLRILLLPKDENDDKNVVVEIRAGAGGEEAALFAGVLYRMYQMYADKKRYKTEIVNCNDTELGGYKEISFTVEGEGAYSRLKFESGVHRVQRVPETEAQGRIQTSTVTVAVLPEAEDVEIEINEKDLQIETCKSSGAGGQHINKTESAIRIIHKPSGIVVECQEERSQYKNRDKAMKLLRSKLYDIKMREQTDKIASERKSQVGTGDRSERIRTYNYPQGRVTDHRIGLTLHSLEDVLNGNMDALIDALLSADEAEKLKASAM
ncbi:MAG: peptide chain release factor 1 [Clostridia bacterium]|nr:peptide chain release factor 1 [Clostridia bacterium]